jgi:hypothetical protein
MILALGLAGGVAYQWRELSQSPGVSLPKIAPPDTVAGVDDLEAYPEFYLAPLSEFDEVFDRPLFSATRRPPEPEIEDEEPEEEDEPEVVEAEPFPEHVKLKAIWAVNDTKYLMLEDSKEKKTSRLELGDKLENWQLAGINNASARFTSGDTTETLKLWVYEKVLTKSEKPKNALRDAMLKRRAEQQARQQAKKPLPKAKTARWPVFTH